VSTITLYRINLADPFTTRTGSYPTVSSHTGSWSINAFTHSLDWTLPLISASDSSGTLEFSVGGDDAGTFFPVKVAFVAEGSVIDLGVANVSKVDGGDEVVFSQEASVVAEEYVVL
jgi:hypothetical protein